MNKRYIEAYTAEYYEQHDRMTASSEARVPICFCVDVSWSMSIITNPESELIARGDMRARDGVDHLRSVELKPGVRRRTRLTDLQDVLKEMLNKMRHIPVLRRSALCSIVTFSQFADCEMEFTDLSDISPYTIERLKVGSDVTNVSKGIEMALERLDRYTRDARNAGNDSYKPVLIFMSDGNPTDGAQADKAGRAVRDRSENGTLKVVPIAIGGADESWLRRLSKGNEVYRMNNDAEYRRVFDLITRRVEYAASVISADENLVAENAMTDDDAKMSSAQYGEDLRDNDDAEMLLQMFSGELM